MRNHHYYNCGHRAMTSLFALIIASLSSPLALAAPRSLPSCNSDRPNSWATHRTLYVPESYISGSSVESGWVNALCCVYTYVEVNSGGRPWMEAYDGSWEYIGGTTSIEIMDAALDDVCAMSMGRQDCNNRRACTSNAMAAIVDDTPPPTPPPTHSPIPSPTPLPTPSPTLSPTPSPTNVPTKSPTSETTPKDPTPGPTSLPTSSPSTLPSVLPSLSPTLPPAVKQNCSRSDSTRVIYKFVNKKGATKNMKCNWIQKGKTLKIRRNRCKKSLKGVKVQRACPVACGQFAGVGICKFLK